MPLLRLGLLACVLSSCSTSDLEDLLAPPNVVKIHSFQFGFVRYSIVEVGSWDDSPIIVVGDEWYNRPPKR